MSRSYRKPVSKVKRPQEPRTYNQMAKSRWRQITRGIKNLTDEGMDEIEYPAMNVIYDMWNFCDYVLNFMGYADVHIGSWHEDWRRREHRK